MIPPTWKLGQTSQEKGTVPHENALTLDTSHELGIPPNILTSDQLATKSGIPATLLISIIH